MAIMQLTFSIDLPASTGPNVGFMKPDLKPSAEFKETATWPGRLLNDYLQLDPNVPPSILSLYIPVDAVQQADRFAEMLALAYKNPILVDKAGVVLLWSLPEVLSSNFQDLMWEALNPINAMLACSVAEPKADGTWCMAHDNFEGVEIQGCLNFSPAWFQQGRNSIFLILRQGFHLLAGGIGHLKARNSDQGGRSWLKQMMLPAVVLSAAMAVMHPDLYASGREAIVHLYQDLAMAHPDEPAL
ncbi:hypothetical protein BDN67DRAFT_985833, partial [Paxillus ammoniavirescens]